MARIDHEMLNRFPMLQGYVTQAAQDLAAIKSPSIHYEEKLASLNECISQEWQNLRACNNPNDQREVQDRLIGFGRQLERLSVAHECGLEGAEAAFEQQLNTLWSHVCEGIVRLIGPAQVAQTLQHIHTSEPRRSSDEQTDHQNLPSEAQLLGVTPSSKVEPAKDSSMHKRKHSRLDDSHSEKKVPAKARRNEGNEVAADPRTALPVEPMWNSISQPAEHHDDDAQQVQEPRPERHATVAEFTPGDIYMILRDNSALWQAVLLLPIKDLHEVGVPYSLEHLGLTADVPSCYDYNRSKKVFNWRKEYEMGGPRFSQRSYPVLFFDSGSFPAGCTAEWVAATELRSFEAKDFSVQQLVRHSAQARKYIRERERLRQVPYKTRGGLVAVATDNDKVGQNRLGGTAERTNQDSPASSIPSPEKGSSRAEQESDVEMHNHAGTIARAAIRELAKSSDSASPRKDVEDGDNPAFPLRSEICGAKGPAPDPFEGPDQAGDVPCRGEIVHLEREDQRRLDGNHRPDTSSGDQGRTMFRPPTTKFFYQRS